MTKLHKVKIEFEIEVDDQDPQEVADAIRSELSDIIEEEDPTDHAGVSVDESGDEDEE